MQFPEFCQQFAGRRFLLYRARADFAEHVSSNCHKASQNGRGYY